MSLSSSSSLACWPLLSLAHNALAAIFSRAQRTGCYYPSRTAHWPILSLAHSALAYLIPCAHRAGLYYPLCTPSWPILSLVHSAVAYIIHLLTTIRYYFIAVRIDILLCHFMELQVVCNIKATNEQFGNLLDRFCSLSNDGSTTILSPYDAKNLLRSNNLNVKYGYNGLFPVTYSCIPYTVDDPMFDRLTDICLSVSSIESYNHLHRPASRCIGNDRRYSGSSVSLSSVLQIPAGVHLNIYCYGHCSASQIAPQLKLIMSKFKETEEYTANARDVAVTINLPLGVDQSAIEYLFKGCYLECKWEFPHVYSDSLSKKFIKP